jgi:hypothetical protein
MVSWMRVRYSLVLLAAPLALACGGATAAEPGDTGTDARFDEASESDGPHADGPPMDGDGPPEAATFACGETSCLENEVCVHPACGCVVGVSPITDAGCPDGTVFADAANVCIQTPTCQPPRCWSPVGTSLQCTGQDGSLSGVVSGPPDGSDLVCYEVCT